MNLSPEERERGRKAFRKAVDGDLSRREFIAGGIAAIGFVLAFFIQRPATSGDAPVPAGH